MSEMTHSTAETTTAPSTTSGATVPSATSTTDAPTGVTGTGTSTQSSTGPNLTNVPVEETAGKGEVKITSHPINEGILNYKGPGLKGLIFSKKYFWFSEQPLEHGHLSSYLGNEKNKDIAHSNAAHATQTGKGLLFFAKRSEDKDHPQGILNVADMSDLAQGNFNDFTVVLHGHKHTFQALNKAERDGWVVRLTPEMAQAKTHRDTLIGTAGYKSALDKYGKPTGGSSTIKSRSLSRHGKKEKAKDAVVPTKEGTTADTVNTTTPTTSGAGNTSDSIAPTTAAAPVAAVGTTSEGTAPAPTTGEAAPLTGNTADAATSQQPVGTSTAPTSTTAAPGHHHGEEAAAGAGAAVLGAGAAKEAHKSPVDDEKLAKKEEKKASRSQSRGNKRNSIFGGLLGKKEDNDEKKAIKKEEKKEEKEVKAEQNAIKHEEKKEVKAEKQAEKHENQAVKAEVKAENAMDNAIKHETKAGDLDAAAIAARVMGQPVVPDKDVNLAGVTHESTPAVTGESAAVRETSPVTPTASTPTGTTTSKANKRNSVFGGFFNKKDASKPTTTGETGPAVPAKDTAPTETLTKDTLAKETTPAVSSTAPQLDHPVPHSTAGAVDAPASTEPTSTSSDAPVVPNAATSTPTEKRRSSFFGGLGGTKKEKRTGGTSGDELTDGEGKKQSGGFGGLLRKASRAQPKGAAASTSVPKTNGTAPVDPAKVPLPAESAATETAATEPTSGLTKGETTAAKSDLAPGEIGSNAIASTESKTPVEATA